MKTYKYWICYESMPEGWKLDPFCGSPLTHYAFATNGKSIFNGGLRALVRVHFPEKEVQNDNS